MILSSPPSQLGAVCMSISNNALEQPRPADAMRPGLDRLDFVLGGDRSFGGRLRLNGRFLWHHQRAQLGVGRQHAVKPDEVQPRPRHQRRQSLHELQWTHHQVRGPVAPRCLELELHLARGVELHGFDVATVFVDALEAAVTRR